MKHKSINSLTIGLLLLVTTVTARIINAQEPQPSPTTPPQKTPTPTTTLATSIPQSTTSKPLTQADLSIITGNTQRPNGMRWHNDKLYIVCSGDSTVYEIDASTGETKQYIYGVRNAHTIFSLDTNEGIQLWIPDFDTDSLVLIQNGTATNITTGLQGPWGIAPLDTTNFALTNLRGNNITVINSSGTAQEVITNLRSPTGIAVDNDYLYVANTGSSRRAIEWFPLDQIHGESPLQADQAGKPLISGLQNTTSIVLGKDGFLYFAYALGTRGVIGRVNPIQCINNGGCSSDQIEVVLYTELPVPLAGLTLSPDMKLYVHSLFSPDLYWVQLPVSPES